uniref:Chromo domain-containing protein n=1 Tax=Heterorhabditis bacteriophora TaxID=37862 RepID=A0A1I7WJ07_HETBA
MSIHCSSSDPIWIIRIIDHLGYEDAFNRRHEIKFRPKKAERSGNIHSAWVYKVEWETYDGGVITTWETEELLLAWNELFKYKMVSISDNMISGENSRFIGRFNFTNSYCDMEVS